MYICPTFFVWLVTLDDWLSENISEQFLKKSQIINILLQESK